jgi:crotonobetainyl-CoA:carnitine CoA-transferase CaiB-like acyl-CoA transferase
MAQKAVTGEAARPMPVRISAWAIYDVFETADSEQVFVGVVSDAQWKSFCRVFGRDAWAADATLALNNQRVKARDRLMPELRAYFATLTKAELLRLCEAAGLPFAPITRPEDLETDEHLAASQGLVAVTVREGVSANLPALPLRMNGARPTVHQDVPRAGEHSNDILAEALGLAQGEIEALRRSGVVA